MNDDLLPLIIGLGTLGSVAYLAWVRNMNVCPNFTIDELTVTTTGIANTPTPEALGNLHYLCKNVLQPLRDQIGRMQITSGYRSPEVNMVLGAQGYPVSDTSQHLTGQAVDFIPLDVPYDMAWSVVQEFIADGYPIDQAGNYSSSGHIHISSVGPFGNRGEVYYED